MTKRAQKILWNTSYNNANAPAINALIDFAAQNSGIEFGNYGDRKLYAAEVRTITQDWKRVTTALLIADKEGVTDSDVIAEAPHAFSGRLEWQPVSAESTMQTKWSYCPGQYFPTEYRKAVATLLEYAIKRVRRSRPPEKRNISTIHELKVLNEKNGGCWFEPATMRFFGTKIESGIICGKYFITSEQPPRGPRAYSVRSFDDQGDVSTVGEFAHLPSKTAALFAIPTEKQKAA